MKQGHIPASFESEFEIGGRTIGGAAPVLVIAEAGVAHFGDLELGEQLVDLAADAGADVFKTQFFDVEAMIAESAAEWRDRLRPRNLSLDEFRGLKQRCDDRGLLFMATAHDETRIPWLQDLDVPAIKVGSGERNNPEFLKKLAGLGKPVVVSTGMYSDADVAEALDALSAAGCREAALLHCVTAYPTPDGDVNLRAMDRLAAVFPGPVGYSDHTPDHLAVLSAVARGAKIIEKHITILRDVPNAQDWKVSAGPEDLADLITAIRRIEVQLGHGRKEMSASERAGEAWAVKSMVAVRDLPAGHVLTERDLTAKRPGGGVPPSRAGELLGRRLVTAVAADEAIDPSRLKGV